MIFAVASIRAAAPRKEAKMVSATAPIAQEESTFATPAEPARVDRAIAGMERNGFTVVRAASADEARRIVLELIPDGATVYHGASKTLDVTGITRAVETSARHDPLRLRVRSMDRATQGDEIRRMTAAPDVMLGSVHAITE